MNWEILYQEKRKTPAEAIMENIHRGDGIYTGGTNQPNAVLNELFRTVDQGSLDHIKLYMHSPCNPGLELANYSFTEEQLRMQSFFMNSPDRALVALKNCSFVPLQYGMLDRYVESIHPEVAIVLMTPPDEEGYLNIGPSGYTPAALKRADRIIAQVTSTMPYVNGTCHRYHVSELAAVVEQEEELAYLLKDPAASPTEEKIAEHILEYIPDGACIQLGIGGIANAVGYGLRSRKHLGVHTEVLTESIVELIESGAVDNSRKSVFPGQTAIGFVFGTRRQYEFIDHNRDLIFAGFDEIVNIDRIASIDNMISINAAVSVDLTGQVCAESIGHRQYSGTGGQLDFVRGASRSRDGASFIAIPSTVKTKNGVRSRIVFEMNPGSIITTPRTDVQYVATEFGVAKLQFEDVPTRVKRLIAIAHPDFRDELKAQAKAGGILY